MPEKRWVVEAKARGSDLTKRGTPLSIAVVDGYWSWCTTSSVFLNPTPYLFESGEDALRAAKACFGPWYNDPDRRTIRAVEGDFYPPVQARFEPSGRTATATRSARRTAP